MAINLSKGQTISLEKKDSGGLTKVRMGVGWDTVKKKGFFGMLGGSSDIDLDASCVLLDAEKNAVDAVYYGQLQSNNNAIQHSGDNLTGEGDGDDETIFVNLKNLPASVHYLAFTVSSFQGQTFNEVDNAFCRLVDDTNNTEIARFNLSEQGSHTGVLMAVLSRVDNHWQMRAIGSAASGRTLDDMLPLVIDAL